MDTLRVALAQVNTTVGDISGNVERVLEAAVRAQQAAPDVIVFPELTLTGYPPEDLLLRPAFVDAAMAARDDLAQRARGLPPLVVGCVERDEAGTRLFNAAVVIHGGRVHGTYRKHLLPNYGVFDEVRYFQPGTEMPLFRIGGVPVGITICEDIWFADGPVRDAARLGARAVLNINASPFHAGKTRTREALVAQQARDHQIAIAYVNQVGGQDELVFDGNSLAYRADGTCIARGASMREDVLIVDLPLPDRAAVQGAAAPIDVTGEPQGARPPLPAPSTEPADEIAEIYDALVLGTRDYVQKSGFRDVLVALSGGIDSAIVGVVAVDALGAEHVTGVSMPSRYSSEGSIADAQALADALGIRLAAMPIEAMHQAALDTLEREFRGTAPGVAEENVQSRIRGLLMMALSNKFGAIVLTTGNKSEYACGYATLYGDMVGGYAVIKDVPKTLIYRLAEHRNSRGAVIPRSTIEKPPSAELRPGQLDTDSLPPYAVLDPIIEAYVEDDRSLAEIVASGHDEAIARRVIDLINRNEYKRRQAAPGVKITPRAFGRDRRLPLASRYRGY